MAAIKDFEIIQKSFEREGYTLLSTKYINNRTKLRYMCPNGHYSEICWGKWCVGQRCPKCTKYRNTYNIYTIKKAFEAENYVLLTKKYINNKQKLKYVCPNGHCREITWSKWLSGSRCPCETSKLSPTIEFVRKDFEDHGSTLLSTEYVDCDSPLDFICENGHRHSVSWSNWHRNHRCGICSGKVLLSEHQTNDIVSNGYSIIGDIKGNHENIHLVCPNGHDYYVSWANWNSKGYRCPRCTNVGTSYQETALVSFIKDIYSDDIISRSKSIIYPYELDIVIPGRKLAIEYCGVYWHSELAGKNKNYHLNKLNLCEEKGIRLITVFEDEWVFKNDIVKSRLKNILDFSNSNLIYARNCVIKEITTYQARQFCEANHLQGYGAGSTIKLGAFYREDLVAVMTFAKPSIAKGNKNLNKFVWELHRFCSKLNYRVVGIASKLFKYFDRNYVWHEIFSYADRRWSDGGLYTALGFKFGNYTSPNYWYIKGGCHNRTHRFALRKQPEEPKDKTEWELRQEQGWNRIWDCGNLKFVKYKK